MLNLLIALYVGLLEPLKFNPNGLGGFIKGYKMETKRIEHM